KYVDMVVSLLNQGIPIIASTSIEGDRKTHDSIRGKGSWDKVEKLIYMLLEVQKMYGANRLQIGFGTVLTEKNADQISIITKIANKLGLYYLIQWYSHSSFYSNLTEDVDRSKERG